MNTPQIAAIVVALQLPDAVNAKAALEKIAGDLTTGRLPPGMNPKGFMKHVVEHEIEDKHLLFRATVPQHQLKATVLNLTEMLKCVQVMGLLYTSYTEPKLVTVSTLVSIQDFSTNRAVAFSTTSYPDDAKDVATKGTMLEPVMLASFMENAETVPVDSTDMKQWERGGKELLEAAASFLEAGHHSHH